MKRKLIFYMVVFCSTIASYGQGDHGKVTPAVADFIRYGETDVSLFSGKMSLEVPIYHYKDNDFDIPIKLVYTAEGFKPTKRADLVGLDWTLVAGGCITREVYGAADDSKPADSSQEYGYYLTVKDGGFEKDKVWNFDPSIVHTCYNGYYLTKDGYWVDYQPDLFMFNFNGHSGQFMIDDDGTAETMNKAYKVDISDLKEQRMDMNHLNDASAIKITTPDGYVYEFGGDISKLEYTINFRKRQGNKQ